MGEPTDFYKRQFQLLRELDAQLHPFDDPGVTPTEPGLYWLDDGDRFGLIPVSVENSLDNDGLMIWSDSDCKWEWEASLIDDIDTTKWRFRKRWEPEQ